MDALNEELRQLQAELLALEEAEASPGASATSAAQSSPESEVGALGRGEDAAVTVAHPPTVKSDLRSESALPSHKRGRGDADLHGPSEEDAKRRRGFPDWHGSEAAKELATSVANDLEEKNCLFVLDIVHALGDADTRQLAHDARLAATQGMSTNDGTRPRTTGGAFFAMSKTRLGPKLFARMRTADSKRRRVRHGQFVKASILQSNCT